MALPEKWEKVRRASEMAAQAHQGQVRAGVDAVPYITHPAEVVQILLWHSVHNVDILTAAWLHDVVEDTPVTLADLAPFGPIVTDTVDRLTKRSHQPTAEYYQHIWKSQDATLIKLADRISNLRGYHVKGNDKLRRYLAYTEQDYTVRDAYGLWDTLQDTIQQVRARLHTQ
jgi:(p)ppGpp synthase/HD superfamily hydrolase